MKALLALLLSPFLISAPALLLCPFLAIALALADPGPAKCPGPECPTLHGRIGSGLPGAPPPNPSYPNALDAPATPTAGNATFQVTASFQFPVPNQVASVTFTPPSPVSVSSAARAGFIITRVGVVMADGKPFPGTFGPLKPISMPAEATAGGGRILMPVAIDPKTGVITVASAPLVAGDYSFDVPVILP